MRLVPGWLQGYERAWVVPDVLAGLVVWSVVVPQAVAYAQLAGLPPEAGLLAAPGALLGYALLGTSRSLVVGATTATAALSANAVGPLAHGDGKRFAALSAALALVAAAVFVAAGLLRVGGVFDLISPPVMTGFLFGLGLSIAAGQLPKLLGVDERDGHFFTKLWRIGGELGDAHGRTVAVGLACVAALLVLRRWTPGLPGTLIVLVGAIAVSSALGLSGEGVAVVGHLPRAVPHPQLPDVSWHDVADLVGAGFGVLLLSSEAVGITRAFATAHGDRVDTNRDLIALGGSNLLAGLCQGFVQSGGSSQTAAAERAGGKSQLASLVAAVLVLLTGAFLSSLFKNLPEATLAAIVIVAVSGFWRVGELVRVGRIHRSALVFALVALVGVLVLGVLPGLLVAAGLSLISVIQRLSRPPVSVLARDPASGAWGRADRHPGWATQEGVMVARVDGPLFYANGAVVKDQLLELAASEPRPDAVVLDLEANHELDVASLDMLAELTATLTARGSELRLAAVRAPVLDVLRRGGLADRIRIDPTVDQASSVAGTPAQSPVGG